jgi:hypothetical protein
VLGIRSDGGFVQGKTDFLSDIFLTKWLGHFGRGAATHLLTELSKPRGGCAMLLLAIDWRMD